MSTDQAPAEHFDVLIVGAGLSGIGAGYYLQKKFPGRSYAILESRADSGGTWDLFRYPGVRCDSDMYSLGYSFRPWGQARAIADGSSILDYLRETAEHYGIDQHIRCNHRVTRASWSSQAARWTVAVQRRIDVGNANPHPAPHTPPGTSSPDDTSFKTQHFTCHFLFMCCGYYSHAQGYAPALPGIEHFAGRVVHPQHWPSDLDYRGKHVTVIGSGATAVTLVPALATAAAHVTMLQRSPGYVISLSSQDPLANTLRRRLPASIALPLVRWKNVLRSMLFFEFSRRFPARVKRMIRARIRQQLGPDYDTDTHFSPRYQPWDQRLCVAMDGDFFAAIREGRASIVTDEIETCTSTGIQLRSGAQLEADLLVTATGLNAMILGEVQFEVDGQRVDPAKTTGYQGMMYSDIPNLASALGYTNAAWTLKGELTCEYVCRLLTYMDKTGYRQCTPRRGSASIGVARLDFSPGYIRRALDKFPRQGARPPWKLRQNYLTDLWQLRFASVDDGIMEFSNPPSDVAKRSTP